jgi:hypothetical protein
VRVHLAIEHASELELADLRLDGAEVSDDVAQGRFVVVVGRQRIQLARIVETAAELVECPDDALEGSAFLA